MSNTAELIIEAKDNASATLSGISDFLGGALQHAVGNLMSGAFNTATQAVGEFFSGALDAEKGLAKLQNTIRLTGEKANFTEEQALGLADKFKNLAGGSDDAIIAIQEMGLRMGITGDEMDGFIKSTLDLGAVTGSTENAAFLLSLAQEDVTAAMNKAKRAGILLTDAEKEHIKTLEDSGDKAGATAAFMDILASKTAGMAETMAGTTGAKLDSFKERLMDIGENAVTAFLPMLTTAFDGVAPLIEGAAGQVGAFAQTVAEAIASGNVASLFPPEVLAQIQPLIDAVMNLGAAFQEQLPAMQATAETFIASIQASFGEQAPQVIANLTEAVNTLAAFWREWGDEIMAVTGVVFTVIADTIMGAITLVSGIITAFLEATTGDWDGAWATMQDTLGAFLDGILQSVGTSTDEFISVWTDVWELLKVIVAQGTMNVTAQFQTWLIDLINGLRAKLDDFIELGRNMAFNIMLGITMLASQIAETAAQVVTDAIAAAGAALTGSYSGAGAKTGHPYGGGHAAGGQVVPGVAYTVGERGPELFASSTSGRIIPNGAMGTSIGAINISIDGAGDPASVARAVIRELQMRDLIPAMSL